MSATIENFPLRRIDGKAASLADYRGKVLLIVNVASKCGFTPQYEGLERLSARFSNHGFAVLGFPANDFAEQEPGTNAEIAQFCTTNFGVTFPVFEKITVAGPANPGAVHRRRLGLVRLARAARLRAQKPLWAAAVSEAAPITIVRG